MTIIHAYAHSLAHIHEAFLQVSQPGRDGSDGGSEELWTSDATGTVKAWKLETEGKVIRQVWMGVCAFICVCVLARELMKASVANVRGL